MHSTPVPSKVEVGNIILLCFCDTCANEGFIRYNFISGLLLVIKYMNIV